MRGGVRRTAAAPVLSGTPVQWRGVVTHLDEDVTSRELSPEAGDVQIAHPRIQLREPEVGPVNEDLHAEHPRGGLISHEEFPGKNNEGLCDMRTTPRSYVPGTPKGAGLLS